MHGNAREVCEAIPEVDARGAAAASDKNMWPPRGRFGYTDSLVIMNKGFISKLL